MCADFLLTAVATAVNGDITFGVRNISLPPSLAIATFTSFLPNIINADARNYAVS
jgi:hypothetical protein